ncbi:hypothetical protein SHIRM173S_06727 [Streptomyces hirsutus]
MLLSDEATSALDPETTRSILTLLRDLNRQLGLTVLLIAHEMDVVKSICDSAALMEHGRVVESGTVTDLLGDPRFRTGLRAVPGRRRGVGRQPHRPGHHLPGRSATQPVISRLARTYNIDISILGAAIDTVGGLQVGRMRIELPGSYEDNVVPIGFLREQGLHIETVEQTEPARQTRAGGPGAVGAREGGGQVTWSQMQPLLEQACGETLIMVGWSTLISVALGIPIGVLFVLTDKGGLLQNGLVNKVIGQIVNVGRSMPFIILMVALMSFTRWITGTTIGSEAAIVPLAIGGIPFFARLVETAVREVDHGLVEAVQAMGGNTWTIVRRVLSPRSTALADRQHHHHDRRPHRLLGHGRHRRRRGLGDLAVRYGYQRFETGLMWITVAVLAVVISLIQFAGDYAARSLHHRGGRQGSGPRLR